MNDFTEKNKIFFAVLISGIVIAGLFYHFLSKPAAPQNLNLETSNSKGASPSAGASRPVAGDENKQSPLNCINFTEAPNYIGETKCIIGKVNDVFISEKGNIFLNFCSNYKTCPFTAVIFSSDADKFSNPRQFKGKTVEITGLIKTYQGRPEIILNAPNQIKIK